jgi:integrase
MCSSGTFNDYMKSIQARLPKEKIDVYVNEVKDTCPTFKEIWEDLLKTRLKNKSCNTMKSYKSAYNKLSPLYDMKINTIKLNQLQPLFDKGMSSGCSRAKLEHMKIVLSYVYTQAIRLDLVNKNYASDLFLEDSRTKEDIESKKKTSFTKEEIKLLFAHDDDMIIKSMIIMIYSGMRIGELLNLKKENVFFDDGYMIGGSKTEAGKNRTIPIHDCIRVYLKEFLDSDIKNTTYRNYNCKFKEISERYNLKHTAHSCRHTFATLCHEYGVNELCKKRIIGHTSKDLTENVYTHVTTERLIEELKKIPTLK